MRDYLQEPYAFLGAQRIGPDLANAGWRFTDRLDVHTQLYAPRSKDEWSVMPSFKHLYIVRKQQGPVASNALKLTGKYAPKSQKRLLNGSFCQTCRCGLSEHEKGVF